MPDAYICGHLRRRKSLVKPVMRQNISSCSVLSPEIVMHDDAYIGGHSVNKLNASCMTISGERTEQLYIFCSVTSCTSDFLSFIDVELIRFFHEAVQLTALKNVYRCNLPWFDTAYYC